MKSTAPLLFKLGILQCDRVAPELASRHGDYPDMFRYLFESVLPNLEYTAYDLTQMQFPASLTECDAWLFTGSKWSVYDDEPWIKRTRELALALHRAERPLVGICFGHQLIAEALGGKVVKSPKGWGVGAHTTNVHVPPSCLNPKRTELKLLVSHQDQVVELPEGAQKLAGHAFCPNDIVQIGDSTLTFQGHPEFTKGYSRALMKKRQEILGEETYKRGVESLEEALDESAVAQWIVTFFQETIEKKSVTKNGK